jgi:UDP-N-acetyl-D-mannosaminuronic acid transferase (WecB/TagA/CpsF family)
MATASKIHFDASQQPQFYVKGLTPESAEKTSQLLQVNHEKHHVFFNQSGFHVRCAFPDECTVH